MSTSNEINRARQRLNQCNAIRIKDRNGNIVIFWIKNPSDNKWYSADVNEKTGEVVKLQGLANPDTIAEMMVDYKEYGYSVDTNYIEFSFDRTSELSKSFKHHPIVVSGVNYNYRGADDPSTRKAQSGDYSTAERFHGKRTRAPKKSLADTFDKNFRKML